MKHCKALVAALFVPLAVTACLLLPGKFESTLTIRADRSFTYTYKGEVIGDRSATPLENAIDDGSVPDPAKTAADKAAQDAEYRDLAAKLAGEAGYRTVEYRGDGLFYIDYAISGRLTHNFVFPYNQDAKMLLPFFAAELRGKDQIRVRAPGFVGQESDDGAEGTTNPRINGVFTLITDAEIVSQNQIRGAEKAGADRIVRWKITPATRDAPTAVLKVAGL